MLSREGVPFVAKNVDEDEAAYAELLQRGFRTIPVTVIGDTSIRGYEPEKIQEALAARKESGET